MRSYITPLTLFLFSLTISINSSAAITKSHGYALYGKLKYPSNFTHFDYVNPKAPKGGSLKLMGHGTFDSLNPYILKGISPGNTPGMFVFGFGEFHDSLLMGTNSHNRLGDEAKTAYGLIAESIEYPESRNWAIFNLRKNATFHDGHSITADDVIFSFNLLKKEGHPDYQIELYEVSSAKKLSKHRVKFTFTGDNKRALPLQVGKIPILPKHYWQNKIFNKSSLDIPLLSGPYKISVVKAGHSITFGRVKNYWAKNLPVNKGRYNFDTIKMDFYRDAVIAFEAFKAGQYDLHLDYISKHWARAYDIENVQTGKIKKQETPHKIAQGSQAFFFNLRREKFKDIRVRKAINLLFDFEWTNKNIFNSAYKRSNTYYPNSDHIAVDTPSNKELTLLKPFKSQLPNELFKQSFRLNRTDGSGRIRKERHQTITLLKAAGWQINNNQLINTQNGEHFSFEILNYHSASMKRVVMPFVKNLERVGIKAEFRMVDPAQYKERMEHFDFDMTIVVLPQYELPSFEQYKYFHSDNAHTTGNMNYGGIENPVVDALVEYIQQAKTPEDLKIAVKALDRVLLWNYYTIPHWYLDYHRLAFWDKFERPAVQSDYTLGIENWWAAEK